MCASRCVGTADALASGIAELSATNTAEVRPMAKKTEGVSPTPATTPAADNGGAASKATMRLVDGVRESFTSYVTQFVALNETRAQLAPRFMKAYNAWASDTGKPFVAFVRLFDPTVPTASADYRKHKAFMAADYLRRLVATEARAEAEEEAGVGTGIGAEAPATPQEAIARLIAAILPLIALEQHPKLWQYVQEELHWTEARVKRLQEQVGAVRPLAVLSAAKGQPRPTLFLAHTRKAS
jgi:hypothetical protein